MPITPGRSAGSSAADRTRGASGGRRLASRSAESERPARQRRRGCASQPPAQLASGCLTRGEQRHPVDRESLARCGCRGCARCGCRGCERFCDRDCRRRRAGGRRLSMAAGEYVSSAHNAMPSGPTFVSSAASFTATRPVSCASWQASTSGADCRRISRLGSPWRSRATMPWRRTPATSWASTSSVWPDHSRPRGHRPRRSRLERPCRSWPSPRRGRRARGHDRDGHACRPRPARRSRGAPRRSASPPGNRPRGRVGSGSDGDHGGDRRDRRKRRMTRPHRASGLSERQQPERQRVPRPAIGATATVPPDSEASRAGPARVGGRSRGTNFVPVAPSSAS